MSRDEFDAFARQILLSMVQGVQGGGREFRSDGEEVQETAKVAVELAIHLEHCLRLHHHKIQSGGLTEEEAELVRGGNKIAAIKLVRVRLGLSLKDAKAYVDQRAA